MTRIGLIGAANSHAAHFAQTINREGAYPGYAITHVYGQDDPEAERMLCDRFGLEACASDDALIASCDAVVVTYRKGSLHHAPVMKALKAGRPVFNDKPFATDVAQAREIVETAQAQGRLLCGGSSLKSLKTLEPVRADIGPGSIVTIAYAADLDSVYDGYWFYGIHSVEMCLALLGEDFTGVRALRAKDTLVAAVDYADRQCLILNNPALKGIHITVASGERTAFHPVEMDYESVGPDEFIRMLETGKPPRPYSFYLRSVELLCGILKALA